MGKCTGVTFVCTATNRNAQLLLASPRAPASRKTADDLRTIERKIDRPMCNTAKRSSASLPPFLSLSLMKKKRNSRATRHNLRACGSYGRSARGSGTTGRPERTRARRSTVRQTYRFLNLTYSCIKSFWDLTSLHSLFSPTPNRSHERLERTYVPGGLVRVCLPIALSFSFLYLSLSVLCVSGRERGVKEEARGERRVPSAFDRRRRRRRRPLVTGQRATRADDLPSRGAALPPRHFPYARKRRFEAMLTASIRHTFAAALVRDPSRTKNRPTLRPKVQRR